MDQYVECFVKRKTPGYLLVIKAFIVAVIVMLVVASFFENLLLFVAMLFGIGSYFLFPYFTISWEYIFVTDTISFDKIIQDIKRKTVINVDMENVEAVGKFTGANLEHFYRGGYKKVDFTSGNHSKDVYYLAHAKDGVRKLIFFEPNEKLLKAMKHVSPSKVTID